RRHGPPESTRPVDRSAQNSAERDRHDDIESAVPAEHASLDDSHNDEPQNEYHDGAQADLADRELASLKGRPERPVERREKFLHGDPPQSHSGKVRRRWE